MKTILIGNNYKGFRPIHNDTTLLTIASDVSQTTGDKNLIPKIQIWKTQARHGELFQLKDLAKRNLLCLEEK